MGKLKAVWLKQLSAVDFFKKCLLYPWDPIRLLYAN
jgi:hypothetical protein